MGERKTPVRLRILKDDEYINTEAVNDFPAIPNEYFVGISILNHADFCNFLGYVTAMEAVTPPEAFPAHIERIKELGREIFKRHGREGLLYAYDLAPQENGIKEFVGICFRDI